MPVKGFSSITVSKELYQRIQEKSEENRWSMAKLIEYMFDQVFPESVSKEDF